VESEMSAFTAQGLRLGAAAAAVLIPGVAMYGAAFGVMASSKSLSFIEATFFSAWVNAGGAQMASLEVWKEPVSIVAICLTIVAMNTRYILLGATLRPTYEGMPYYKTYPSLFFLGDGNWALAMREHQNGRADAAFLVGSGIVMWLTWVTSTAFGHVFGDLLGSPERLGIDFMLAAFFAAMAFAFFKKSSDLLPFIVGALVAVVVEKIVEGPWYIIAGALSGSLAGYAQRVRTL
jgi:branched chain amino acid efflux pump